MFVVHDSNTSSVCWEASSFLQYLSTVVWVRGRAYKNLCHLFLNVHLQYRWRWKSKVEPADSCENECDCGGVGVMASQPQLQQSFLIILV